ncbi:hypothetical protein NHX12_024345 [Muraenolepis orangiensis]|uniref:Uncharacterized protein n=1 Tax=Muraenolepis orangiensis TaxID=630683 RepID=A0A9Q0IQX4_9TELE|nr:hypothetical protein NHX12_024345 [Muraenolepis orangiensis]
MAVCRGGTAFWVGCVRGNGNRQPIKNLQGCLSQAVVWQWVGQARPLNTASWALAPSHRLRCQTAKQPVLSHPFPPAGHPFPPAAQVASGLEDEWEDLLSVCVLVRAGEPSGQPVLVEVPLFGQAKLGELLTVAAPRTTKQPFTLTTVDGTQEDDISVAMRSGGLAGSEDKVHSTFRHLFRVEKCPAPFVHGSVFYCFHCPEPAVVAASTTASRVRRRHAVGLESRPLEFPLSLSTFLCSRAERVEGTTAVEGSEEEEKLALMYERLSIELPNFFLKPHDYSMYSSDVEFINGVLIDVHTRGSPAYRWALCFWRLLCTCYYTNAQMEVLKLTKHPEEGSIKARWRVNGLPYHRLLFCFYRKDKSRFFRPHDAFSTFYIGHDGLIHCHKVEKVMEASPPILPRVGPLLAGALVALGVQEHRPALNLLPLFFSSRRQGRN